MLKIAKFGGSSVASSEQFKKIKNIVDTDDTRKFIVTSACGKANSDDHKVTDLLYLLHAHVKYGVDYKPIFNLIKDKYVKIKNELNIEYDIEKDFDEIEKNINKNMNVDYLVSRGEYLTGRLLSKYLDMEFLDSEDFVTFNYDLTFDMEETKNKFLSKVDFSKKYVIPGFYGVTPNGDIKVMERGGSDITGAIVANIADCDLYENWTDVSGIMVTDPRIVDNPKIIDYMSFEELREISYMGANVLNDESIFPCQEKGIPINIRNTNDYKAPGTMIVSDINNEDIKTKTLPITCITGKRDYTIVNVKKNHIAGDTRVLKSALKILESLNVSIEMMPSSIDSFSLVCETKKVEKDLYKILSKLEEVFPNATINVEKGVMLICIVGRGMAGRIGFAGSLFSTLGENNINVKIINQGSDELNITIGIEEKNYEKAVNAIYNKFIK